jgi:hypothetical protein
LDYLLWLEEELAAGQPMESLVGTFTMPYLVLVDTFTTSHLAMIGTFTSP